LELSAHQDKIIGTFNRIAEREKGRASEAGTDREDIGKLLELTGLNKKAVSFTRALHKMTQEKRDDVLRSLTPLLELMGKVWDGQSTPDMFDGETVEPADDGEMPAPSYAQTFTPGADAELDEDSDDFDKHLAQVAEAEE